MDCGRLDSAQYHSDCGQLSVLALLQPGSTLLFLCLDPGPDRVWYLCADGDGLPAAEYLYQLFATVRPDGPDHPVFLCPGRPNQAGSGRGPGLEPARSGKPEALPVTV